MNIIDRRGQYIVPGRAWYSRALDTVTTITVHHSADPQDEANDEQVLNNLKAAHANQGWPGLAYHIVYIPRSRKFYWINDFSQVTWHDAVNWDSIGILVHGYYHAPHNEQITANILSDLKECLDWLCTEWPQFPAGQYDVYGHRERSSTACPGDKLAPYVVQYRTSGGAVSWGSSNNNSNQNNMSDCLVPNTPEWRAKYEELVSSSSKWAEAAKLFGFNEPKTLSVASIQKKKEELETAVRTANAAVAAKDKALADALREVENRKEQVSRLQEEARKNAVLHAAELEAAKKGNSEHTEELAKQLENYKTLYADEAKAKGAALRERDTLKAELATCKNNPVGTVETVTLWEIVYNLLKSIKIVK